MAVYAVRAESKANIADEPSELGSNCGGTLGLNMLPFPPRLGVPRLGLAILKITFKKFTLVLIITKTF